MNELQRWLSSLLSPPFRWSWCHLVRLDGIGDVCWLFPVLLFTLSKTLQTLFLGSAEGQGSRWILCREANNYISIPRHHRMLSRWPPLVLDDYEKLNDCLTMRDEERTTWFTCWHQTRCQISWYHHHLSLPAHSISQSQHSLLSPDLLSTNQSPSIFFYKIEIYWGEKAAIVRTVRREEREEREVVISRAIMAKLRWGRETNFEPGSCCQPIYQTQSLGAAFKTLARYTGPPASLIGQSGHNSCSDWLRGSVTSERGGGGDSAGVAARSEYWSQLVGPSVLGWKHDSVTTSVIIISGL